MAVVLNAGHAKHLNPINLKLDQAHDQAFTVAKAMRLDLLSDIETRPRQRPGPSLKLKAPAHF